MSIIKSVIAGLAGLNKKPLPLTPEQEKAEQISYILSLEPVFLSSPLDGMNEIMVAKDNDYYWVSYLWGPVQKDRNLPPIAIEAAKRVFESCGTKMPEEKLVLREVRELLDPGIQEMYQLRFKTRVETLKAAKV